MTGTTGYTLATNNRHLGRRGSAAALAVLLLAAGSATAGPAFGVAGGTPAGDGYGFVAHIEVGDNVRGCSGALIDPEWVVTATSCFAEGGQPVQPGPPAQPTTVTVGRADLATGTGGQVRSVAEVVPHPSRDLLLAKLASPVVDIAPVKLGTTAPVAGDALRVVGYGRTATEWVPDRLHTASLAVQTVGEASVGLGGATGDPTVCKGDAGGPALRAVGSAVELVAVHSASWQAGCLETPAAEARTDTAETRLDNVLPWVRQIIRGGNYVRLANSAAVLDTRNAIGAPTGVRAAGSVTDFQVTGVGGVPATGVTAVLIDVTAVTTSSATFLTVFPQGNPRPNLSTMNATANQIISNSAVVNVPANGKLSVLTNGGGTHIVIDVQGYFTRTAGAGGGFVAVDHARLVDTRTGVGSPASAIPAGGSRAFTLTGGAIPAGASTAFIDLIVTGATGQGWIGTFATGGTDRSVMDFVAGTTSHGVSVKLTADGRATFVNHSGAAVHLVLTATGYYTASATTGQGLRTMTATRLIDTRSAGDRTPLPNGGTLDLATGLPAGSAAMVNFTVVNNTAATGYLKAWPLGGTEPATSLSNFPAPDTGARAGLAAVKVGTDGRIRIRNVSSGTVHLLVDVQGWFVPSGLTVLGASGAGGEVTAAAAEPPVVTSGGGIVETYAYPGAAQVLAERGVRLHRGDGRIVLVDCGPDSNSPPADMIVVQTYDLELPDPNFCFRARGTSGFLTMEIPMSFLVRGDNSRTIAAKVETLDDPTVVEVERVDPTEWQPVGVGQSRGDATILELRFPYTP